MTPRVSVCIPAFRDQAALKRCLDSVALQTYQDYEVVITDDSPGEDVESVARGHSLGKRVRYIRNPSRLGSPANWNAAIGHARGHYIKIMHHDDAFHSADSLAGFVNLLESAPGARMGFSACYNCSASGQQVLHALSPEFMRKVKRDPFWLFPENLIGSPSTCIHRRDGHVLYDPNIKWVVDIDFYIRYLSKHGGLVYTREPLVDVHQGDTQVTNDCLADSAGLSYEWTYLYERIRRRYLFRRFWFMTKVYKNHGVPPRERRTTLWGERGHVPSPLTRIAQVTGRLAAAAQRTLRGRRRQPLHW